MPLTPHGTRMLARFRAEYGPRRGTSVFYATAHAHRDTIGGRPIHPGRRPPVARFSPRQHPRGRNGRFVSRRRRARRRARR